MNCPVCQGHGCTLCGYTGNYHGVPVVPTKPAPKVGELHPTKCKRCKNDSSIRIITVGLDKLTLFCKLCGTEQEVKR